MASATVLHGDCLDVLRNLPDASVDAIVTDPPYGLAEHKPTALITALTAWANGDRDHVPDGKGFMGRDWDAFVPPPAVWDECLRVLRPGGHLLAFAGSRTADLMGLSVRMAGFEIRDTIMWVYGSGMPKGLDVGKAIDATTLHGKSNSAGLKAANASRPGEGRIGPRTTNNGHMGEKVAGSVTRGQPATDEATRWQGWNTSLRPAQEPIIVARKPLTGTVAATVLAHGTGALNIGGCRVGDGSGVVTFDRHAGDRSREEYRTGTVANSRPSGQGRWPANVVLTHAPDCVEGGACVAGCPVADLDQQSGITKDGVAVQRNGGGQKIGGQGIYGGSHGLTRNDQGFGGSGGASRFFPVFRYQAKAPSRERPEVDGVKHPTVKPLALMRWLVRLVTPPGGIVLDPFAGSGTTVEAALLEGFQPIGIERDPTYLPLIQQRIDRAHATQAAATADVVPGLFDIPA